MIAPIQKNRNTGEFIDNIHWWFWNGAKYPGLISREQFSNLADEALCAKDHSELSTLLVRDSIVSSFEPKRPSPRLSALLRLVGAYLEDLPTDSPCATLVEFIDKPLVALKAYLNILDYWGYGYSWQSIGDLRGRDAILIKRNEKLLLTINVEEINYIRGRPFRFEVSFKGLSWRFDEDDHLIRIHQRNDKNDGSEVDDRWLS